MWCVAVRECSPRSCRSRIGIFRCESTSSFPVVRLIRLLPSKAGRWKHDPSSRYEGGTRLSKTYTLNFRALQLSTFCESDPTQIVLNPKEPSPKSLIVVHPSSLLFFACKRIVSAPQPSETDLLLLLAIYWFEEDAVLEPGTFFDVEKIKRLTSSSSGSQLWQDMLDKIRSDSVSARIMKLSEVSLGRLIGRTHLINMFGSITRKVRPGLAFVHIHVPVANLVRTDFGSSSSRHPCK